MKQLRSRLRLITLLLFCAFVLAVTLCAGAALRTGRFRLPSLSALSLPASSSPASPSVPPEGNVTPAPGESEAPAQASPSPEENETPGDAVSPDPVYNTFGL